MTLFDTFRKRGAPIALVSYTAFLFASAPRPAYAEDAPPPAVQAATTNLQDQLKTPDLADAPDLAQQKAIEKELADAAAQKAVEPPPAAAKSLPTGADKSGVSSQAISVPQGAGKIQGMGESFSAQLSTGIATYSVPFSMPSARGGAQPSLALSYSSSAGHGNAGLGWDIGWPYIARQTDKGLPKYIDPGATFDPETDHFVYNGGQELVPICRVSGTNCQGALTEERMPAWADGYWYYRPRVEGGFLRFFFSPALQSWRVQDKSGVMMELGVPQDGTGYKGALETNPSNGAQVFRWNLVRQFDIQSATEQQAPTSAPVNVVHYRYKTDGAMAYLSDIFDTSPVANSTTTNLADYAHHTRLTWEQRTDPTTSYRRGWPAESNLRLKTVDVASKSFVGGTAGARELVRRYHLTYDAAYHPSLLQTVQLEGRCASAIAEDAQGALPAVTSCPTLPPITLGYEHVEPFKTDGSPGTADLPGFEGFDERVRTMVASPDHSIDEELTDLFDVNADGLPDVLVTAPALYHNGHGVFVQGETGVADAFTLCEMGVSGTSGADAATISLKNGNVQPLDLDGNGVVDLLHMPKVKTYAVFSPDTPGKCKSAGGSPKWRWVGKDVTTANAQSPKIDFGKDAGGRIRVMDVNGDGLVDVLVSSGTRYETYFAQARLPGGYGQFGTGKRTGETTAQLSQDPVAFCVPWAGLPIQLDDPDVRLGDMNGDGLTDIVIVRPGDFRYFPGRGNGLFGTGDLDNCGPGTFGQGRHVQMTDSPYFSDIEKGGIRVDDVNGDGLDDIVQVRFDAVDVWLNVDGLGWTKDRHIIAKAPHSPSFLSRTRLVDVNGSGTRDILWGDGNAFKYMDLAGGARPWVLTSVANGLGKTTELEYSTSTKLMLAAEKAGKPWSKKAPMSLHVVTKMTDRDHLAKAGRPDGVYTVEYLYEDPVYDGVQREFRGFSRTVVTKRGDANSPTSFEANEFLLGECSEKDGPCSAEYSWVDRPREALKGLPRTVEVYDEKGTYLTTTHHTYELRKLYKGLDARHVWHAFEKASDTWAYDTAPFSNAGSSKLQVSEIEGATTDDGPVKIQSGTAAHMRGEVEVDSFGNKTLTRAYGQMLVDPVIVSHSEPELAQSDQSGWMWRTVSSWVEGEASGEKRKETKTGYDLKGRPIIAKAVLSGGIELDRDPVLGAGNVAPQASPLSGEIVMSETEYDGFGNAKKQLGANGRCRKVAYDAAYGDLAISESTFTGGDCTGSTGTELTTSATYDRGWEVVTQATGFNDECSRVEYDGFGRITKLFKPSPADGKCETVPSVAIEYRLTTDPIGKPYSLLHTQTLDGHGLPGGDGYQHAWGVVDGMGRTIVTLAEGEEANQWIVNGLTEYDQKGATRRAYLPWFYTGEPDQFPLTTVAQTKYSTQRYDAFGRQVETTQLDGIVSLRTRYHALSTDMFDAGDLQPGPYQGTPASGQKDGHGRVVRTTERVKVGGTIEERYVDTTYLPSGEVKTITRSRGSDSVVRWMRYDSLGRMVWNVEPSTSKPFNPNPNTAVPDVLTDGRLRAWRYAYNDAGDLVGTSDARGCGVNFHYDGAGRLLAEDYSPCEAQHAAYSAADAATGLNTEVFYQYDGPGACAKGKLVFVKDRASSTSTDYDCRGRVKNLAKQIALPGAPSDDPNTRYASRIYSQSMTYDVADRPVTQSTGATHANIVGANGESTVTTTYTARGTVKSVTSSYGDLVTRIVRDAEGKVLETEYGDGAHTTTTNTYDDRRRLRTVQTYRAPPAAWNGAQNGPPETFQLLLEDSEYFYDVVDNPIEIKDWRTPSEWPTGAKPVSRQMEYDDLYRLKRLTYKYEGGDDGWVSPFAAENAGVVDARRATPTPHVSFDKRPLEQTYNYDWLGNTTSTGDDAKGFYDRSLGAVTNDTYRITSATLAGPKGGTLDAAYDAAGNMTGLRVQRSGACLPVGATCAQRYAYDWDEVGRLNVARRWDFAGPPAAAPPPVGTPPAVELRYAYDAGDDRTIKTAVDPSGNELHTLYVFGSLELRRTGWVSGEYDLTDQTESAYLSAHGLRLARLVYEADGVPVVGGNHLHVFFELGDHLGSTSTVLDRETGELVEKGTYQAHGSVESDYRPGRWGSFREDYRFTGKEEDAEVGLVYFGKRFLNQLLGRWASADPLAVQGAGADPNTYSYVSGRALRAIDPLGLQAAEGASGSTTAQAASNGGTGAPAPAPPPPPAPANAPVCSGMGTGCTGQGYASTGALTDATPPGPPGVGEKYFGRIDKEVTKAGEGVTKVASLVRAHPLVSSTVVGWSPLLVAPAAATSPIWGPPALVLGAGHTAWETGQAYAEDGVGGALGHLTLEGAAIVATDGAVKGVAGGFRLGGSLLLRYGPMLERVGATHAMLLMGGVMGGGVGGGAAKGAGKVLPELEISASKYPQLAENISQALGAGHPSILTHGGDVVANRAASLRDVPRIPGLSRDEFPFASSMEGGAGAWVGHVPVAQQNAQGGLISSFLQARGITTGMQYRVVVTP